MKKFLKLFIFISICFVYISTKANNNCIIAPGSSYYNISFETNGGKSISNISVCGSCPDLFDLKLPNAQRDGYTFDGWYADKNLTIKVNSIKDDRSKITKEEILDNNNCPTGEILMKLYAKWVKNNTANNGKTDSSTVNNTTSNNVNNNNSSNNKTCEVCDGCSYYNISFETNGGEIINNVSVCSTCPDIQTLKLPYVQRDGYTFNGWYADEELSIKINNLKDDRSKINAKEVLDNNNCPTGELLVNLYAKWDKVDIINNQKDEKQNNMIIFIVSFAAFLAGLFILGFAIKRNLVKTKN